MQTWTIIQIMYTINIGTILSEFQCSSTMISIMGTYMLTTYLNGYDMHNVSVSHIICFWRSWSVTLIVIDQCTSTAFSKNEIGNVPYA